MLRAPSTATDPGVEYLWTFDCGSPDCSSCDAAPVADVGPLGTGAITARGVDGGLAPVRIASDVDAGCRDGEYIEASSGKCVAKQPGAAFRPV